MEPASVAGRPVPPSAGSCAHPALFRATRGKRTRHSRGACSPAVFFLLVEMTLGLGSYAHLALFRATRDPRHLHRALHFAAFLFSKRAQVRLPAPTGARSDMERIPTAVRGDFPARARARARFVARAVARIGGRRLRAGGANRR